MKFKQPARKTGHKTVRRAVAKKRQSTAGRKSVARRKKAVKKSPVRTQTRQTTSPKLTRTAARRKQPRRKPSTVARASVKPVKTARKPRKRSLPSASVPPRRHRVAKSKPTPDTIPPLFPTLDLPEEILTESAPVFLMSDRQRIEIPAILLETEHPQAPASAGDGRLHVAARDPHWLYVHWDLTRDQQANLNAGSDHGHMIVRIYQNSLNSVPSGENDVHPQSRHWFAHVEIAGATYYVELGLYTGKEWRRVAVAGPVTTSRQRFAFDTSATYLTIHPDRPLIALLPPKHADAESGCPEQPTCVSPDAVSFSTDWSPEQQLAVLRALGVIRTTETVSGSGGGGPVAEPESNAGFFLGTETFSSVGDGFDGAPGSSEFASPASSADVPLYSLADFPNPSS